MFMRARTIFRARVVISVHAKKPQETNLGPFVLSYVQVPSYLAIGRLLCLTALLNEISYELQCCDA
mgnify:CR=1 FL=1